MTNLIVLGVDDLTYWVGANTLFSGQLHAPNLQRLADSGVNFTNAYTPEAICNPARTSFFSGQTPDVTGVHANDQAWYEYVDPSDTLPAAFLAAGYEVGGYGKLMHGPELPPTITDQMYSEYVPLSGYENEAPKAIQPLPEGVDEDDLADHRTIDAAIDFLNAQGDGVPFMLNVGMVKPHLSWVVPQEYYDLYPLEDIEVPGLVGDDLSNVPAFIRDQLVDSRGHPRPHTEENAKLFMQGYMASISCADAQIGRLFDALGVQSRHLVDRI